jgi:hypothetical protein
MSTKINVYIKVEGTPSSHKDTEVAGEYLIELDGSLDPTDYANTALDIFHISAPVSLPEDFSFRVFAADGTELQDDLFDHRDRKYGGKFIGKIDSLPFATDARRAAP